MINWLAYLRCRFYYEVGNLIIYLAVYESISDFAYSVYNECMHRSISINDKYDLDIWRKP